MSWLWAVAAATAVLALLYGLSAQPMAAVPETPLSRLLSARPGGYGAANYAEELARLNAQLQTAQQRMANAPTDWGHRENLAVTLFERGKLTGSFADLDQASREIDLAAGLAPDPGLVGIAAASIAASLHEQERAARFLAAAKAMRNAADPAIGSALVLIEADQQFYQGNYAAARRGYQRAANAGDRAGRLVRLAIWHQHHGDFPQAQRDYAAAAADAAAQLSPLALARILLMAGGSALQNGVWANARRLFERADRIFPGYWLAQAHVAQIDAAQGNLAKAEARYRRILTEHFDPDVMEALAAVRGAIGQAGEAQLWTARAEAIVAQRYQRFPLAYADHRLDAALTAGDADSALAMARQNVGNRAYGDAQIGLARARFAAGDAAAAKRILRDVEASGWRSAEQYAVLAEVCAALRDAACQRVARKRMLAINPRAEDPARSLLLFGVH
jgi:tetratricopeptide (TPR) repeat protein